MQNMREESQIEQLINLYETSLVGLFKTKLDDGVILSANAEAARIVGLSDPTELVRKRISVIDLYLPGQRRKMTEQLLADGYLDNYEITMKRPDGRLVEVAVTAKIFPEQGYLEGSLIDITTGKRVERERSRLAAIIANSSDMVSTSTPDQRITYLNPAGWRMLGFAPAADITTLFIRQFHPRWAYKLIEEVGLPAAIKHGTWTGDTAILTQHAVEIPVSQVIVAHLDETGELEYFSTIMRDISEQKRAEHELRESESQLLQSEKLAAIGELASGVAHELNQPLNHISITVQLLERLIYMEQTVPGDILNELSAIRGSISRAVSIIRSMRDFSRRETSEPAPVDVRQAIANALMMFGVQLATHDIELILEQPAEPVVVLGSENYLGQVFVNLITNARDALDACDDGRRKFIRLEVAERCEKVIIRVSDNGIGIPERIIGSIFNPFFTTKEPGSGTGLGLSIIHRIIEGFGGTISAQSTEERGTVFTITLPRYHADTGAEGTRG